MLRRNDPCVWCGRIAQALDHVEALALGRLFGHDDLDQWWNLAPMCRYCHRIKTRQDVADIQRLKHKRLPVGSTGEPVDIQGYKE